MIHHNSEQHKEKGAYQVVLIFDIAEYFIHCIAMEERTC
ncbi:hypothetical protein Tsp_15372 [Trichinella spiralis]|nr:hypothetical protein Tsp_15372 [Trichinella spiralis]